MYKLTVEEAVAAVRKNLDEVAPNESVMYNDEDNDNLSINDIVRKNIAEAINLVHLTAPVELLEGEEFTSGFDSLSVDDENVLHFSLSVPLLRLVAFRAADSRITIHTEIPEVSPEGRKQLNEFLRGRYDRPRLVRMQGLRSKPEYAYYSLKDDTYKESPVQAIKRFSFVREVFYDSAATEYPVCASLRQNAIDQLTSIVLATYNENDKAKYFAEKVKII